MSRAYAVPNLPVLSCSCCHFGTADLPLLLPCVETLMSEEDPPKPPVREMPSLWGPGRKVESRVHS